MQSKTFIYQTLESRNLSNIRTNGPFDCKWENAWLGYGFYFWDSHIELAHWWGRIRYAEKLKKYVVTKGEIFLDETCWDLHGNGNCRMQFYEAIKQLKEKKLFIPNETTVPHVISFLKLQSFFEKFQSIRVLGSNSIKTAKLFKTNRMWKMFFEDNLPGYFELYPPVQICLFTKTSNSFSNYQIVYPENPKIPEALEDGYLG